MTSKTTPLKNILVFPCGSEIGLEIHRSLKNNTHYRLIGGSSIDDHGKFVYENYIGNIPFHDASTFLDEIRKIVKKFRIDAIYPSMDSVAVTLKNLESEIGVTVIGSSEKTTLICASKSTTYTALKDVVPIPRWSTERPADMPHPIFIKPDVGYGSRNVCLATDAAVMASFIRLQKTLVDFIYCDYLPGKEYTIDCFSNRHEQLIFTGPRERTRVSNGISTNTRTTSRHRDFFKECAENINRALKPRGAWFFQMKEDHAAQPKLLEVATRLGGSSSLFRSQGINFALLSIYDAFDLDVRLIPNNYEVELDRALNNRYRIDIDYDVIYIDYDDCLLVDGQPNPELISFLFRAINQKKKVILITKHAGNIKESLRRHRISDLFDEVIHLESSESKCDFINPERAIFIDDSFAERLAVKNQHGIPVFSLDMIEALT